MESQTIYECIATVLELSPQDIQQLDDDALLSEQGLDSLHFVQLIVILEETFNIEILDSDLLIENFQNKKSIMETLEKYWEN